MLIFQVESLWSFLSYRPGQTDVITISSSHLGTRVTIYILIKKTLFQTNAKKQYWMAGTFRPTHGIALKTNKILYWTSLHHGSEVKRTIKKMSNCWAGQSGSPCSNCYPMSMRDGGWCCVIVCVCVCDHNFTQFSLPQYTSCNFDTVTVKQGNTPNISKYILKAKQKLNKNKKKAKQKLNKKLPMY